MEIPISAEPASLKGRTIASGSISFTVAGLMAARHSRRARTLVAGIGDPIGQNSGTFAIPRRPRNLAVASPDRWNPAGNSLNYPPTIFETTNPAVSCGGVRQIVQTGGDRPLAASCHLDYNPAHIWEQLP